MKRQYHRLVFLLMPVLLALCVAQAARQQPARITAFDLSRSPLLRGFERDSRAPWRRVVGTSSWSAAQPPFSGPPAASTKWSAQWEDLYFDKIARLDYQVWLFPSRSAMQEWDTQQKQNAASWGLELPMGTTSRVPTLRESFSQISAYFVVDNVAIHVLVWPDPRVNSPEGFSGGSRQRFAEEQRKRKQLALEVVEELANRAKKLRQPK